MRSRVPAEISKELRRYIEPGRAESSRRFFQTGSGQYGETDRFLGIRVPHIRKVVKKFRGLPLDTTMELLASPWHEERVFALLMLVDAFRDGGADTRNSIYRLYMENTRWVNSWDLVDLSAPHIPGAWLFRRDRDPLYRFAAAADLWKRRISIVATLHFIRENDFQDTLGISEVLLHDDHHLIHKAAGWMLREVGKRDPDTEEDFLRKHCLEMPRTMLRYAIERFPEQKRQMYLRGEVR